MYLYIIIFICRTYCYIKPSGAVQNPDFRPLARAHVAVILLCLEPSVPCKSLSLHQSELFEGLMTSLISLALSQMNKWTGASLLQMNWPDSHSKMEKATYRHSFRRILTSFWKILCSLQNAFTYSHLMLTI